MKRRDTQERDDAIAREQAEDRREKLLADLKAREEAGRQPPAPVDPPPDTTPEASGEPEAADADASAEAPPPSDET